MAELDKNEKNWLVKSSSKIIGPFSAIEVAKGIIKKHISIIDEVRQPQSRWVYIRENSIFSEVVQGLRHEQSTHVEETMNTAHNTQTLSRTDWAPTEVGTPTPTKTDPILFKDVTPVAGAPTTSAIKQNSPAPSFGTLNDQRVHTQMEKKSRSIGALIWTVTFLLTSIIGFVIFKKVYKEGKGYDNNIRQALHFNHILLHEKSVDFFHRAQEIREPDQATSIQVALPVLQIDRNSLWARKVFESELSRVGITRQENSDAFIGIGLSHAIDGDLKIAQDFFRKALATDPDNLAANINLAFTYLKKGDFGLALNIFNSIKPPAEYRSHVTFGIAALAAESQNYSHKEVQKELKDYLQIARPLRKEIGILLGYLQMVDKNQEGLNATIASLISMPLQESADFTFEPRLDRRIVEWEYLERFCHLIFQNQGATALGKSFRALCYLEENRDVEAKKWIDQALAQEPKNEMAMLTQAHFLIKNRRRQEAATLLRSPELKKFPVTSLLLGKVCQDLNDQQCALENFRKAYLQNSNDVTRIDPWARINQSKEKEKLAKTWDLVKRGLELQPQYKPLIELRDQLENE